MLASALALLALAPTVQTDVVYRTVAGQPMKMDIYRPASATGVRLPAVVVIHGGAWVSGARDDSGTTGLAQAIAQNGLVAASVSYRLAPKHRWPAMLEDVQAAVRFLRANSARFGIDPDRIGAAGASAGGHLSLMLGMRDSVERNTRDHPSVSSRVTAVFNLFGPTDMTQDFAPVLRDTIGMQVVGKRFADAPDIARDMSPVNFINARTAPVFTVHGTVDMIVPVEQARRLDRAMRQAGREHRMVIVEGMGHAPDRNNPTHVAALAQAIQFLREELGAR